MMTLRTHRWMNTRSPLGLVLTRFNSHLHRLGPKKETIVDRQVKSKEKDDCTWKWSVVIFRYPRNKKDGVWRFCVETAG